MSRVPNVVIAGTVKGGTTSIFRYLALHPQICASKKKETCYFLPLRYGNDLLAWSEYEQLFDHCADEKYVIEATPGYFDGGKTVAEAIKARLGDDVRIIITLRNPTSRLISFFKYKQAQIELPKDMTLAEYVTRCTQMPTHERHRQKNDAFWGVDGGRYMQYLPDWFSVFGERNIKIVFFDAIVSNPHQVMNDLCDWLDLDPEVYSDTTFGVENKTVQYQYAWMHRLAVSVNMNAELFLRKHPKLKEYIKKIYYKMNGDNSPSQSIDVNDKLLKELYMRDNQRLSDFLITHGYKDLPTWLSRQ